MDNKVHKTNNVSCSFCSGTCAHLTSLDIVTNSPHFLARHYAFYVPQGAASALEILASPVYLENVELCGEEERFAWAS
jgi:hypothetical protein